MSDNARQLALLLIIVGALVLAALLGMATTQVMP